MRYEFIQEYTGQYPMGVMFEAFGINPSGYYDWLVRPPVNDKL